MGVENDVLDRKNLACVRWSHSVLAANAVLEESIESCFESVSLTNLASSETASGSGQQVNKSASSVYVNSCGGGSEAVNVIRNNSSFHLYESLPALLSLKNFCSAENYTGTVAALEASGYR